MTTTMRGGSVILGLSGVVWGGAILVNGFVTGPFEGSGAYVGGQVVAYLFAVVILVAGARALAASRGSGDR